MTAQSPAPFRPAAQLPLAGERGATPLDFQPHQAPTAWFCAVLANSASQAMLQEGSAAAAQGRAPDWALPRRIAEAACQGLATQDHSAPWVCAHHAQLLCQLLHMQLAGGQDGAAVAEQLRGLLGTELRGAAGAGRVEAYLRQCFPLTYFDICFRWAARLPAATPVQQHCCRAQHDAALPQAGAGAGAPAAASCQSAAAPGLPGL